MRDPLFIRVGSSRPDSVPCRIALADECSLGDKAFANVFAGSFFIFA